MVHAELVAGSPAEVDVDPDRLEQLFAAVERRIEAGTIPGAQVAIGRGGKLAGMRSFGSAVQGGGERPVDDETLFCIYSATKAVVGAAMWALIEDGQLAIEERVADIVPEFAGQGKGRDHRGAGDAAHRRLPARADASSALGRSGGEARADQGLEAELGSGLSLRVPRHLGALAAGRGHPPTAPARTSATMCASGSWSSWASAICSSGCRMTSMGEQQTSSTWRNHRIPLWSWVRSTAIPSCTSNLPSQRRAGCPGGGGFASAGGLALFYQALAHQGPSGDRPVLNAETIELATQIRSDPQRHRNPLTDIPVNRGLTVVVAGDDGNADLRGFGDGVSPQAFGHGGAGGQVAWGDPSTGISLGFVTNGFAGEQEIAARTRELSTLAVRLRDITLGQRDPRRSSFAAACETTRGERSRPESDRDEPARRDADTAIRHSHGLCGTLVRGEEAPVAVEPHAVADLSAHELGHRLAERREDGVVHVEASQGAGHHRALRSRVRLQELRLTGGIELELEPERVAKVQLLSQRCGMTPQIVSQFDAGPECRAVQNLLAQTRDHHGLALAAEDIDGVLGGFKWSSQRLEVRGCDGKVTGVGGEGDRKAGDAVSRPSTGCAS